MNLGPRGTNATIFPVTVNQAAEGLYVCQVTDAFCDQFSTSQAVRKGSMSDNVFQSPVPFFPSHIQLKYSVCPSGTEKPLPGVDHCVFCPKGTYKPEPGRFNCSLCPAGAYCPRGTLLITSLLIRL